MKATGTTAAACAIGTFLMCALVTLYVHRVDTALSQEDKQYIPRYLEGIARLPEKPTYTEELNFIISVQRSVLKVAAKNQGLPFDQQREPMDLYIAKTGLCYDRSRAIEKILIYAGFKTRHVSVYAKKAAESSLEALATPDIESHSITEVLTQNGWLVVDSNTSWISTDKDRNPVSLKDLQAAANKSLPVQWSMQPAPKIFRGPFIIVYGLYSRHGRFYPPYNFIPDIHYGEFLENLW
ncbi:MAG: hypothetical protein JW832_00970 [Deltaproteobacteria bacterium]|nr:hypothetical protein [Deltaproteobacteria bacterium]